MGRKFFLEPVDDKQGQSDTAVVETPPAKKKFFLEPVANENEPTDFLDLNNIVDTVQSGVEQAGEFVSNEIIPEVSSLATGVMEHFENFPLGAGDSQPGPVEVAPIPSQVVSEPVPSNTKFSLEPIAGRQEEGQISAVDVSGFNPALVAKVDGVADKNGIPKEIFRGLVKKESSFNPNVKDGGAKEVGLVQIKPGTFKQVSPKGNIRDIDQNLEGGARYLKAQYQRALSKGYAGVEAWKFAASAYNGGPGNLNKAIKKAARISGSQTPSFDQVAPHLDQRAVNYAREVSQSLSMQPESFEARAKKFGVIRPDKSPTVKDNILDSFKAVGQGVAELTAVYGHLLDKIGNPIGKYVQDLGKRDVESLQESFNPENLETLNEPALISTGSGTFDLKLNPKLSKRAIYFKTLKSLPASAFGIGSGAVINKTLLQFAKTMGVSTGKKTLATVGAVSFGFGEGVIEGGFTSMEVAETILHADQQTLLRSPLYRAYLAQGLSSDDARTQLADSLSSKAGFKSGLIASALGAPMGAFFGKLLGGVGGKSTTANIIKGAAGEIPQEFGQGVGSGVSAGQAKQEAGIESNPLKEGIIEGTEGAIVAPFAGGPAAGIFQRSGKNKPSDRKFFLEPVEEFPTEGRPQEPSAAEPRNITDIDVVLNQPTPIVDSQIGSPTPQAESRPVPSIDLEPVTPTEIIQSDRPEIKGVTGSPAKLRTVSGDQDIIYRIVSADDLIQSNDPETFAKNPDFPEGVQERQLQDDKISQDELIRMSENLAPDLILTNNPDATNGPPVVTPGGVVIGGNGRTIAIKRAFKSGGKPSARFKKELLKTANEFGIDSESVKKIKNPILVRQLTNAPGDVPALQNLGSDLNRNFTKSLSVFEQAVSRGNRVSEETFKFVSEGLDKIGENATLRQLAERDTAGILNRLQKDGVIAQNELSSFVDQKRNLLTESGKDFIERALLGSVINDPVLLSNIPAGVRNKIAGILPSLSIIKSRGSSFDLTPDLKSAANAVIEAQAKGLKAEQFLAQTNLFDDGGLSERGAALFKSLVNDRPNTLKKKFRALASAASQEGEGQASFLPSRAPDEIFKDVFEGEGIQAFGGKKTIKKKTAKQKPLPNDDKDNHTENDGQSVEGFQFLDVEKLNAKSFDIALQKEATTKETTTKANILDLVENAFGVPVRNRVTRNMRDAAGWFEGHGQLIRLKAGRWGSVEILTHELGHHIDNEIKKTLGKSWKISSLPKNIQKKAMKELQLLDYDQSKKRISEGFAEFLRHYMTTGRAEEFAPTYFKWFNNSFLKRSVISEKGEMRLLPEKSNSLVPFVAGKPSIPAGFQLLNNPFSRLKKEMQVWYGQGSTNRMKAQIDFKSELPDSEETKARKAYKFSMREFYDSNFLFEEVTEKVKQITGKEVPPDKDPFQLATFYKGKTASIAENMIRKAMVDPFGKRVGPSLVDAIRPAKLKSFKQMEDWLTFAVALRAKNNAKRGLETGFDVTDINHVIGQFKDKAGWIEAAEGVTEWSNQLMDWYVWSGDLSPELKKLFRDMNPIYLPFMRVFRESINITKGAGGFEQKGNAVKSTKGSTRPIKNPMESFIESAAAVVSRSIKTKIANTLADFSEEQGIGGIITPIPSAMHVKKFKTGKIIDQLKDMGVDISNLDPEEVLNLWYRDSNFYGKDNVVSIWRDGELKLFEVHKELYEAMKETDSVMMPAVKFMAPFARLQRLGATGLNFGFSNFTNPVRDFVFSAVTTKRKWSTPASPIRGLLKEFTAKPNSITDRALNSGLQMATMMGFDRKATQGMYDEVMLQQLGLKGKTLHVIKHPIDTTRRAFQFFELAPRIVELETYKQIEKEHPEWSPDAVFIKAFNNAQDVTVNFTKSGRTGKQINEISAFFNVSIQGPNKLLRAFKENKVRTLWRSFIWVTVPAILFWDSVKDKEWYKNIPPEHKYMNMWYEQENGDVLRIPGAHELFLLFGGLVIAGLDEEYRKDKDAVKGAVNALKKVMNPLENIIPSVFNPLLDVGFNSNWLGHPIEPEWMRNKKTGLPVEERKRFFTPELSIQFSEALRSLGFKVSPIQTDHILRQMTGGLYSRGVSMMDTEREEKHPILPRAFLRFPNRPTRQLDKFFTERTLLQQRKNAGKLKGRDFLQLKRMNIFYNTQVKPIQGRIRRKQQDKTLVAMVEINRLYGLLSDRFNKFFDPRGGGKQPFKK